MPLSALHPATPADHEFAAQVRSAFLSASRSLTLGELPLARTPLIDPALVLDPESPSLDERGQALQHLLSWATERLAPDPARVSASLTQPISQSAEWVSYNLLRFLYLQPDSLADDENRLPALGVAAPELFYEARSRAFAEASAWLMRQRDQGVGTDRIRALALEAVLQRLLRDQQAHHLAGIASIFSYPVARTTLLSLAADETVTAPGEALERAFALRVLQRGEGGATVWMARPLREFLAARQPRTLQQSRHQRAARHAQDAGERVRGALHHYEGGNPQAAAELLIEAPGSLGDDKSASALLNRFEQGEVTRTQWRALQQLRAQIAQAQGASDQALRILRGLLDSIDASSSSAPLEHAALCLALGKLLGEQGGSQREEQALALFQSGLAKLAAGGENAKSELPVGQASGLQAELLKEAAWIHIRQERLQDADHLLQRALRGLSSNERTIRADLYDAFSTLRRAQNDFRGAIEYAQAALLLREGMGDAMRLGRSYNALGILYRLLEEYDNALQAYQRALAIFQWLDNGALVATAMLNIGTAYHFTDRLTEAERWYRRSLLLAEEADLPVTEVRAHANLCETLIGQGREEEARLHWRSAWARSHQLGYPSEIEYLKRVAERYASLAPELEGDPRAQSPAQQGQSRTPEPADEAAVAHRGAATVAAPTATEGSIADLLAQGFEQRLQDAERASEAEAGDAARSFRQQYGAELDSDEAHLIALLQHVESINVAAAIESTGASKATATRKLARMVERGLLVRHGQGRATYYTRAHGVPPLVLATNLEGLQNRLDVVALRFAQEYNLVRARVTGLRYGVRSSGEAELCYEVKASFTRNPLLDDFFALERALSRATGSRIQLTL